MVSLIWVFLAIGIWLFLCDVLYDIIIESGPIGTGLLFLAAERVSACISSRSLVFLQEHRHGILLRTLTVRLLLCLTAGFLLWRLIEYVKFFLPLIPAGLWIFREKIWALLRWADGGAAWLEERGRASVGTGKAANGIRIGGEATERTIQAERDLGYPLGNPPARQTGVQVAGCPTGLTPPVDGRQAATLRAELAEGLDLTGPTPLFFPSEQMERRTIPNGELERLVKEELALNDYLWIQPGKITEQYAQYLLYSANCVFELQWKKFVSSGNYYATIHFRHKKTTLDTVNMLGRTARFRHNKKISLARKGQSGVELAYVEQFISRVDSYFCLLGQVELEREEEQRPEEEQQKRVDYCTLHCDLIDAEAALEQEKAIRLSYRGIESTDQFNAEVQPHSHITVQCTFM